MRLAVFGRTGQVATELRRRTPEGVTLEVIGRDQADLAKPAQVAAILKHLEVDTIINAAAYTSVDRAEEESELAHAINGESVGTMAEHAAARGIPFVHVSTDYVFDGSGSAPWTPVDATRPLGVYGTSKLAGEDAVRGAGGPHAILRTSWVFSAHGSNFVKTMLRLSETHDRLTIVDDQVGGPTPAAAIADALFILAQALRDGHAGGTCHFSGAPDTSWADFAREIFLQANRSVEVTGIPSADYPTPARRPLNSRLDCTSTETDFGLVRPDWRAGLADVLKKISQ